jgi:hypothetical protein
VHGLNEGQHGTERSLDNPANATDEGAQNGISYGRDFAAADGGLLQRSAGRSA